MVSVCVISGYGEMRRNARERRSPRYFVVHQPHVVLPKLRIDWIGDLV